MKKVILPKAAKHASRRHCRVWLETLEGGETQLVVDVMGQNGMLLDGEKVAQGENRIVIAPARNCISLGFYSGVEVSLNILNATAKSRTVPPQEYEESTLTSEATLLLDLASSPASHRLRSSSLPAEEQSQEEAPRPAKRQKQDRMARSSSVAAPSPFAHQDDDGFPPESSSEEEEEEEMDCEVKRMEHGEWRCQRRNGV